MNKVVYQSIKIIFVAITTSLLAYFFLNIKIGFVITMFFWILAALEIPYLIKSNYIDLKAKITPILLIGLISIAGILYLYGIGKELQNYIVYFFILVVASSIFYYYGRK